MWFMKHIINPFYGWALRTPLYRLGPGLMLVEYTGRRSGRSRYVVVQYAEAGDVIFLWPGEADTKTWWRNFVEGAPATIWRHGRRSEVIATVRRDPETVERGLAAYLEKYPRTAKSLGADPSAAAAGEIIVTMELTPAPR